MKRILAFAATVFTVVTLHAELRIQSVCPRPGVLDENGKESGWVDLVNDGETSVELGEYELVRVNRGKKLEVGAAKKNLVEGPLAAGQTVRVWTSEDYANFKDSGGSGNVETIGGKMVYPNKVNPKKFPYLALYHKTDVTNRLDAVAVPVDIADGSVFMRDTSVTTRYAWNIVTGTASVPYGPNVGPLYGVKHSLSDLDAKPTASDGMSYAVSFPVNPVSDFAGDAIVAVTLEYQSFNPESSAFGEMKTVPMTAASTADKSAGLVWSGEIPADDLPAAGGLIRWRAKITDGDENVWTSPSFKNPDDGYAWYGTLVDPGDLVDPKLPTWHLFVTGDSRTQMDVDADRQDLSKVPYNARAGIFDSQAGVYYDNVRIDLRGNTSGTFRKKSHGFRFSKCQPMVCVNPFENGEAIETRKTSLVAEYCDPSYVRQSLAFHLFRSVGAKVPFHYPVRVNMNGAFFQLAFHSNRFSDEMIEDYYGFDPHGYGYKNSGCLTPDLKGTVVIEKKTPDDGDETSAAAMAPLRAWTTSFGSGLNPNADDQSSVTRAVVRTFDLPAWINYLAAARITMECDDNWANMSTYWDKNGTGTWMPLGYDMNQSWGHIYYGQWGGAKSVSMAEKDDHKAHPFFGGTRVLSHKANGDYSVSYDREANYAMEAVWQSTKFRRLYLRRLRTLMDAQLGAPGTPKEETPVWQYVVAITNAIHDCAALDYATWRADEAHLPAGSAGTFWTKTGTYCWNGKLMLEQGVDDLWENYIVPRRQHLYVTHSVHNTAKGIGYATDLSAGIPDAQSSVAVLAAGFAVESLTGDQLVLRNGNAEPVDLSGWKLSGAVDWTLPAGTVIDADDTVTVVRDRKTWIAARLAGLTAEVVVGNATFTGESGVVLTAFDGASATGCAFTPKAARPAVNWFDAWAQDYEPGTDVAAIPSDLIRGAFAVEGAAAGTVSVQAGRTGFECISADDAAGVVFTPFEAQPRRRCVTVELSALFPDAVVDLTDAPQGFAGVTLACLPEGGLSFAVCDGENWTFVSHADALASVEVAYRFRMTLDYRLPVPTIVYSVRTGQGWTDLASGAGTTAFPVPKAIEKLVFAGNGEFDGLTGDYLIRRGFSVRLK